MKLLETSTLSARLADIVRAYSPELASILAANPRTFQRLRARYSALYSARERRLLARERWDRAVRDFRDAREKAAREGFSERSATFSRLSEELQAGASEALLPFLREGDFSATPYSVALGA